MRPAAALVRALLPALLGLAPGLAGNATAQGGLALELAPVVDGLARPLAVSGAGDDSGRLFIAEQAGLIRVWDGAQLLPTPFLNLAAITTCCGERGLLGLAFDPDYESNGFFYVGYTDLEFDTVIARYSVSADPDVAEPGSALVLLQVPQPNSNHNNGHLAFGPDGYLYVGLGDGGGGQAENAQNLSTPLGSILRIDPDGDDFPDEPSRNYAIPPDNPFVGVPAAREEIWVYGLRNPWRFSFDRNLGDLLIGDVGQQLYEEIDHQPAASSGGENYGWPLMEAESCFEPEENCNDGSLTLPVIWYAPCGGPEHLVVDGAIIAAPEELVGCSRVTLGPDLTLQAGADVVARAGAAVQLVDGVIFEIQARVRIQNDPSLLPRQAIRTRR